MPKVRVYTDEQRAYARCYAQQHLEERKAYWHEYAKTHDVNKYKRDRRVRLNLLKPPKPIKVIPVKPPKPIKVIPVKPPKPIKVIPVKPPKVIQLKVEPIGVRPSSIGIFKRKATWMPIVATDPTNTRQTS